MNNSNILDDSLNNQDNSEFNLYTKKKFHNKNIDSDDINDIILSIEFAINAINRDQNKFYIIQELENVITKLKKYSSINNDENKNISNLRESKKISKKPPSSGLTTIELKKNLRKQYNYSPLRPQRNNSQDNSFYNNISNNISFRYSNKTNKKLKESYLSNKYSTSTNKTLSSRISLKNSYSPISSRYNGNTINGKKEGKGIYYYPNGCRYEGYFKNDKKEGKGIFYYANGDRYEGNFEEGNYEGNGIFYFSNGDRYEGNFEKNKYSGKGKYFYHNGDYFDGYWIDDKKTGEGTYYCKNGDKIIGKYYNGKPYGLHVKHCSDGKNLEINY